LRDSKPGDVWSFGTAGRRKAKDEVFLDLVRRLGYRTVERTRLEEA